jgi:hypothetical protein
MPRKTEAHRTAHLQTLCRARLKHIAPHIHVLYCDVPYILYIKKAAPETGTA